MLWTFPEDQADIIASTLISLPAMFVEIEHHPEMTARAGTYEGFSAGLHNFSRLVGRDLRPRG
jgi:hypothetical protein